MTWLAWRQARAQVSLAAALTGVVAVVLVATRSHIAAAGDTEELSTGYKSLQLLGTALIGLPAAIGAFWGAPLVAREIETGTHRLAWTQSVTRRRWLGTKLALLGLAAVAVAATFSALFTWWSLPLDASGNRIGTANFGQRGVAPIAYSLFALALGALFGTLMRRTLPAMAATLLGFFVARFSFQWLVRPHLLATELLSRPSNEFGIQHGQESIPGAWVLSSETVDASGRAVHDAYSGEFGAAMARVCGITIDSGSDQSDRIACINQLGLRDIVRVHPADHFWPLQAWESLAFLCVAIVISMATFWWLRHRTS